MISTDEDGMFLIEIIDFFLPLYYYRPILRLPTLLKNSFTITYVVHVTSLLKDSNLKVTDDQSKSVVRFLEFITK